MGNILVIGSYNRDTVLTLARFPEAGETLTAAGMAHFHGGKGSNQAVAAARAGGQVSLIAAIGDDAPGEAACALWAEEGIDAVFTDLAFPGIFYTSCIIPRRKCKK